MHYSIERLWLSFGYTAIRRKEIIYSEFWWIMFARHAIWSHSVLIFDLITLDSFFLYSNMLVHIIRKQKHYLSIILFFLEIFVMTSPMNLYWFAQCGRRQFISSILTIFSLSSHTIHNEKWKLPLLIQTKKELWEGKISVIRDWVVTSL